MMSKSGFVLRGLKLFLCFLLVESTPKCLIKDDNAYCDLRGLYEVPVLPPYITYLDLSFNNITEVHEKSFYGLEALQTLKIQQQDERLVLRNNAFSGLSNLRELNLIYNTNLQVDPGAFNGLFNLQILDLKGCTLSDSILSGDYLRPLLSLEQLSLSGNNIKKIRPAPFFVNMSKLHTVDISHNWINSFCEDDLFHFQGKHFTFLKLFDIKMFDMNPFWSGWDKCGNPFKNMSMTVLDLSLNGFSVDMAVRFFKAIRGTKIHILILNHSGSMGRGFWFNMKDPDQHTFKDLSESDIKALDLSKAKIFVLKSSIFHYMPHMLEMSLAENVINQIEKDAFYGLGNLRMLNLSHNLLDKVDSETFNNLQSLETLDLSNNNIRLLNSGSFQGLPNLSYLFLSENSLQTLHTLANLPSLKVLFLDKNKISSLYGLPNQAQNLTTIDLQNNRLSNAESFYTILEFPNIEFINLGGNGFSWCVLNAKYSVSPLNKVRFLDLRATVLQNVWVQEDCLDMFDHLQQLQTLILQNNFMQSLPENIFKGLISLNHLDLSLNSLTYIPNGIFPKSLRRLNLAYNNLGSVDPQAFSSLSFIDLFGNRFLCDCGLQDFQTWLNQTDVQMSLPAEELMCEFPQEQRGRPLLYAKLCEDEEDEKTIEQLRLTLFICCTVLIMITTIGAITFVRLRGYCYKFYRKVTVRLIEGGPKLPASCDNEFMYDIYLCFSSEDIKWVTKALLKKLDTEFSEQNDFRCCFEARDFIPGQDHLSNMRNAIWKSKKTLCVLSREFFKDGWCLEAFSLAQTKMEKEGHDVLLVLLVDNIPHYKLMKFEPVRTYFQTRRYLCWPEDSQDLEWFYSHLKQRIIKDTNVKQVKKDAETNHEVTNCEAVTAL